MSERNDRSKEWKSNLLQTSIPLELTVEGILRDHGLFVVGEFPYLRPKESAIEAEFSVDTWARSQFAAQSLLTMHILVECKYVTPGATWLFAPLPAIVGQHTAGLQPQLLTIIEETSALHVGPDGMSRLSSFGTGLSFASKGVTVHEKHIDLNSIRHGLYQMRFALPNLLAVDMRLRTGLLGVLHQRVAVVCGILVTTAPIRILKASAPLEAYMAASSLEDITDPINGVIVWQYPGPELLKYCRKRCADLRDEGSAWAQMVEWRAKLIKDERKRQEIDQLVEYRFIESTHCVAIIHLDALSGFLENLLKTVELTEPHVAFLEG